MQNFTFFQDWDNDGMMSWTNPQTLSRYKKLCNQRNSVDLTQFDCFCTFSDEQFAQGIKQIRALKEGEKLIRIGGGIFATKDGFERLSKYYEELREKITKECDPQEVYCYEFNNYESCIAYDGDIDAIRLIIDYWGEAVARSIERKCAFYSIDWILQQQ